MTKLTAKQIAALRIAWSAEKIHGGRLALWTSNIKGRTGSSLVRRGMLVERWIWNERQYRLTDAGRAVLVELAAEAAEETGDVD